MRAGKNFSARRSLEAFSGSRPRRASESRNIRPSSSAIWAATFSCVNPILSRSERPSAFFSSVFLAVAGVSSSKTPAA